MSEPAPDKDGGGRDLARMCEEYGRRLAGRLHDVQRAVARAGVAPAGDAGAVVAARTLLQRLRGTAATFGFVDVGATVWHVEEALDLWSRAAGAQRGALWRAVEEAMAQALRVGAAALVEQRRWPAPTLARMLVVDADAAALAEVARFGAALSIDVATAGDEDEAIMHARMAPPDAAFLGADLTGSGALARRLRELPGCEALPIAFLSAADGLDRRMEAAHAGASLFLRRPLDRESFAAAARQLTTAMRAGRARVLVVDEDADFAEWAMAVLGAAGVLATPVCDATTLLDLLAAKRPDLVVVDRGMPGADVLDLCRLLRADPRWVDLPIVCLSNDLSPETRFAAFEAGVDDFLVKPILAAELVSRVKLRIERAQLRRERSERDALTGLLLRRPFLEQVSRHFVRDRGDQLALSIGLIDLDDFKAVNDRHGHLAGDLVLAALGSLIDRRLRAEDLRARWGGEEFVVAFPGQRAPAVTTVLTRVLDEFAAMEFHGDRGEPFRQAFSAGVATFPGDGESLQGLLRAADRRLYLAKAAGRSRVTMLG